MNAGRSQRSLKSGLISSAEPYRFINSEAYKGAYMMRQKFLFRALLVILLAATGLSAQTQVVAVRAGKMFDPKSGTNLTNQVVLISGDKITDVGSANTVKIPAGARVIDLSQATVLPGLIDGHVHLTDAAGNYQHQMMVAFEYRDAKFECRLHDAGGHGLARRRVRRCGTEKGDRERVGEGSTPVNRGTDRRRHRSWKHVLPDGFRAPGAGHGRRRSG